MNTTEDYILKGIDYRPRRKKVPFTVEKRNKFGAVATWLDGHYFKSKKELRRYHDLKRLQMAHEISGLVVHPKYQITINEVNICVVELDFSYTDKTGKLIIEDTKGLDLPMSKLKRRLFEASYSLQVTVL